MGIIAWIVLGAIAGFIASTLMGSGEGLIMMVILGIVGAVVGGFLAGTLLHQADVTGLNVESIVVAVIGAVVVIAVAMSLGIIAWNVALNVGNVASLNVDPLFLGLSLQDVGSSVVAFITTALALGLVSGGREPANRIVVAAAIVGVVTLVVDRFG